MKKCPFCSEEIKNDAKICKHCQRDLTEFRREEATKIQKKNKKVLKIIGWIILVNIGIWLWYIAIPVLAWWYIWKKTKWSKKQKLIGTGIVSILFVILTGFNIYITQPPTLNISEPSDNYAVQAKTIVVKGKVKPNGSNVFINNTAVNIENNGNFNYNVPLNEAKNILLVKATHGSKSVEQKLTINRIFTEEEQVVYDQQKAANEADKLTQSKAKLQRELDSFDKPFNNTTYRDSVDALTLEIALFGAWATMIQQYENDPNVDLQSMAKQLKQKVSQLQVREFPLMRKNYAEIMAKDLWTEDMDVVTIGSGNKTIELTAAGFARNKNIAQIHGTIEEPLKLLRFTRANYKWYKYASEYTYYEIKSLDDSEIVVTGS